MSVERQTSFGWPVAIDMFLGGTGAGVFLVSFILNLWDRHEALARVGAISGPIITLIGVLFLVAELGNKRQLLRLLKFQPTSWMSRGTWIITLFVIFGLGYSLLAGTALGMAIGAIAAVFSFLTMMYTGLLIAVVKRIPFWNNAAVPVLFVASGLGTGVACLLLAASFLQAAAVDLLVVVEIALIVVQLLVLGLHLEIVRHGGTSAAESMRLLEGPLFIVGVVLIGLVVPLGLLFLVRATTATGLTAITGLLLLTGGLLLRYSILKSGVYLPLYSA